MNLTNFKFLVKSEAEKMSNMTPNDISEQVDLIIENQQYMKLGELSESGYKMNTSQTKALFLAFLDFNHGEVKARNNFSTESWATAIKKISQYDTNFAKESCNYMANILLNEKYIRKLSPHYTLFSNPLRKWFAPNSYEEFLWVKTFLNAMKEQMVNHVPSSLLNQVKEAVPHLEVNDNSTYSYHTKGEITELVNEIFNLSIQNHHEASLAQMKQANKESEETIKENSEPFDIKKMVLNLPIQSQKSFKELNNIIDSVNQTKLEETEKLDFDNLLNNQLPQMLMNYFNINEKNRNKIVAGESANTILEDNLTKFKNLFSEIKERQEQAELLAELNNLKINNQYLKSKM